MKTAITRISLAIILIVINSSCNFSKNKGGIKSGTVVERLNGVWILTDLPRYELEIKGNKWISRLDREVIDSLEFTVTDSCNCLRKLKLNDNGSYITVFSDTKDNFTKSFTDLLIDLGNEVTCYKIVNLDDSNLSFKYLKKGDIFNYKKKY